MSKFDALKILKQTKARVDHLCSCCGQGITKGEVYFLEHIGAPFLHVVNAQKFCAACVDRHGEKLLKRG